MAQLLKRKDLTRGGVNPDAATRADSEGDAYETPAWMVAPLLDVLDLSNRVLEPACGRGALARELLRLRPGLQLVSADLRRDTGYGLNGVDFLGDPSPFPFEGRAFDFVVTNPPYSVGVPFIERALEVAGTGVAMLLPLDWLSGVGRHKRLWSRPDFCGVLAFSRAGDFFPEGRPELRGGGQLHHMWALWWRHHSARTPPWLRHTDAAVDLTHDTRLGIDEVRNRRKKA